MALHQRDLDVERLAQQVGDQTERLAEQEGFRLSLEAKLVHARDALEPGLLRCKKRGICGNPSLSLPGLTYCIISANLG
ncbi:hypothetical protein [Paraburkholderia heleia]|uniref:hypothetical protein n=1 Tax=Paraburkholderia heleia TaxID=634127 RepID=UPI002AB63C9D|nr:hypothetical protein [Paraburkholderia heleia]